ncbi:hypothetical protein JNB_15933 [Janibacter sp. HTCC2649]|uniref:ABC transporter permease n=1 Tax=Janibacter sp. HTCC2649 TaxID=313589 RepID=UPI0000671998|nr:ABC transporter permease [Janibacter sp. HTCC2649]EAP98469.1 hypothetical protein JNB_15933 [Janibacter sp. HTCC2649]
MSATVLARASRAEWSRIWSVRSSWAFAGLIGLAVVGLGVLAGIDASDSPGPGAGESAWDVAAFTAMFALFGTVAWAVVTGTADHGTGAIVPTLQWTPRRGILLAARAGVIALTTTVTGLVLVIVASTAVWVLAPDFGLPLDEGLHRVGDLVVVIGCGALLGIGLGLATRSTAAALVLAIALLLVLPLIVGGLPFDWAPTVSSRLPGSGALFLIFGNGPPGDLTPTSARLTLLAWAVAAVAAGGWRLLRSDAGH